MPQPTNLHRERTRAVVADAVHDSANSQVAFSLIELMNIGKRFNARQREQATVNAMLSKISNEGPMRSADLSQFLMLDPSTVSRHICSMADDGLVTRTPDANDRRVQWVDISQSGREHLQAATRARVALLEQVMSQWPEAERVALGQLLEKFVLDFDRTIAESEHA
ncbi:MAG: MarR family transcriptional regulator [Actinomycetota bacterium]|nr:MarR family transcriptional regulator [Actinomycetota bacterium]